MTVSMDFMIRGRRWQNCHVSDAATHMDRAFLM